MAPALPPERGFYMYVLRCADGSLYAGYTVDLPRRLATHQAGKASKYTRVRRPVQVDAWWAFETQREAMRAEIAFKALPRPVKLRRITENWPGTPPDKQSRVRKESRSGALAPFVLGIVGNG
ncbi:MAG: putative endonuclease [Cyanobacteria bacterium RYN_339]|nr:putative endonuclease [Cyanobacteria bacterium RYN_339]